MAKAVGMGDSSGFVVKILDRMEEGFKNANLDFRLVQLHPQDMAGRTLVKDDLIPPIPVATTAPAQAVPASPATPQAVSYTHLDVYKRQFLYATILLQMS